MLLVTPLVLLYALFALFPQLHGLEEESRAKELYLKHAGFTATTVAHFQLGLDLNLEMIFTNIKSPTYVGANNVLSKRVFFHSIKIC